MTPQTYPPRDLSDTNGPEWQCAVNGDVQTFETEHECWRAYIDMVADARAEALARQMGTTYRAREMNAELPEAERAILEAKGMI